MEIKFEFYNEKLLELRNKNKLSQEELAEKIGVSRQTIYMWEAGKSIPDMENIVRLCNILDVSINDITNGITNNNTHKKNNIKWKKILCLLLLAGIAIYFAITLVKFSIIKSAKSKIETLHDISNYYIEYWNYDMNGNSYSNELIVKIFAKSNKYKIITSSNEIYRDLDAGTEYNIDTEEKTYTVRNIEDMSLLNTDISSYISIGFNNNITDYMYAFYYKVYRENENYCFGHTSIINNCRITYLNKINKETGFPVETIVDTNNGNVNYTLYTITVNDVTEADVEIPDLSDYNEVMMN